MSTAERISIEKFVLKQDKANPDNRVAQATLLIDGKEAGFIDANTGTNTVLVKGVQGNKLYKMFSEVFQQYFKSADEAFNALGGDQNFYDDIFEFGLPENMWHTYLHYLLHKASKELKKKVWPILFESAEPKRIAEAKLLRKRLVTAQQKSAKEKTSMTTKKKAAKKPAAKKPAAKKPAAKKPAAKKPAAKKPAAKKPAAKKPAAKKPAAKKPAAKKPAAKKPATEKKDGVGTYVRQLLVDGETSRAVILEKAQSKYPESNILGKDVSWYAWKLKKEGKKIKGLIRETKKASK